MTGVDDAVRQVKEQVPDGDEIRNIVDFMNTTKKGIITKM
jgi:UDP-N-acetylglucosamine acyltransferase